jgi:uncharacterized membrane protein YfcA
VTEPHPHASVASVLAIGAATGVLAGLLGVGGGIIMVPALVSLGFNRHRANATSLATILLVATTGAIGFAVSGEVDVGVALSLGAGGLLGGTLGARWSSRMSGNTLAWIFGFFLLAVGIRLLIVGGNTSGDVLIGAPGSYPVAVLVGGLAGIASGLAGIGGGVIMVPAMVYLLGLGQHTAEGTSLLAILFTAIAATRVNQRHHHIDWRVVGWLSLTGAVLAPLAALAAQRISAEMLTRVFGAWVVLTAIRTLWKARSDSVVQSGP